MIWYKWNTFK